jgi:hypothetical protein
MVIFLLEDMLSFRNEVRRTSPANHLPLWFRWVCTGLTTLLILSCRSRKVAFWYIQLPAGCANIVWAFRRINPYMLRLNRCRQRNCIYFVWVQLMTCPCPSSIFVFHHTLLMYNFGQNRLRVWWLNFKLVMGCVIETTHANFAFSMISLRLHRQSSAASNLAKP